MILLASTSKSDRAAYALMFRQLALTAKAIHDMHAATNDLQRVRKLTTAMAGVTQAVEASAIRNTTPDAEKASTQAVRAPEKAQESTLAELRAKHPGADEETLRAFQIAGRGRAGSPIPTPLTKGEESAALAGSTAPARAPHHTTNEPDLER